MSHHLAGVLGSDAFQVSLTRFWLGDINEDDVPSPLPAADAELTEVQQLELCERLLTKPPTRGHYVVWIAFDLAGHGRYTQDVGPVSFYKAQWLQHALRQRGQHVATPVPGELRSAEGFFGPRDLPDGAGEVLARVDLGTGAWTDPVRVATEQAVVPRNALTRRHTDLKNEFYQRIKERGMGNEDEARLRATIARLQNTIAAKNKELAQLRTDVPALVRAVHQLTLENQQLRDTHAGSGSIVPFPGRAPGRPRD